MPGTGMTYGDVIEQLWSPLRPQQARTAYMADYHREAYLTLAVRYL